MNAKKMMTVTLAAMIAATLEAAVSVTDVKAVPRWPWNGLVDIDYTVTADTPDADVFVFPTGTDNDRQCRLNMRTLTGEGANAAVKPGKHRMTWDAKADQPKNFSTSSFSVQMTAVVGSAPYLVIDLSGGSTATTYPVRFSTVGPDLSDDKCRTTELWMRLILPGTFMMGSPDTELGRNSNETYHQVTLTKAYYMAIFELTNRQRDLVMGENSGTPTFSFYTSYEWLRGDSIGRYWPNNQMVDDSSFLGRLRSRTNLMIDLPTEAMWEYACRAGTTTAINNGKNLSDASKCAEMSEVGRYNFNRDDGKGGSSDVTKVGVYQPNAWGLYDMHGNVPEWCLDGFVDNLGTAAVSNPTGSDWPHRAIRGGSYGDSASGCRSAYRTDSYYGFGSAGVRLCCFPGN